MKKVRNGFIQNLRYLCLIGFIALGLMTIVGTGGGGGGGGGSAADGTVDVSGYWKIYHTTEGEAGEEGPGYLTCSQSGNDITVTDICYPDEDPWHGTISGTSISISWTEDVYTTSLIGTVSDNTMSGTWSDTDGDSGTWRAEKTGQEPTLDDCVIASVDVWCVRVPDGSYYVDAIIEDPSAIVESAYISGDFISGTSPLTCNPYGFTPGEWWTDPAIFISQGTEPEFPLDYTVHINFKDESSQDVSKTVTDWEWAN